MPDSNSLKQIVKYLWDQRKTSPKLVWTMLASQAAMSIMSAAVAPIFVSRLMTHIANGSSNLKGDIGLLIIYSLILLFGNVLVVRLTIVLAYITETKMQSLTAKKILEHLTAKSLNYHSNRMSGGIVSDSNKLTGSIERFWDMVTFNIMPILTTIISTCIILCFVLWQFAILLALMSALVIFVIIKAQTSRTEYSEDVAKKSSAMTAYFADIIGNISVVKAFAREDTEIARYQELTTDWRKANIKEMKYNVISSGLMGLIMNAMNVLAFSAAILVTEHHIASIGTVYLVVSYTLSVVSQLWATSHATRTFLRVVGDASPMIKTLSEDIELKDPKNPSKLKVSHGKIELKNIRFTHDKNDKPIFDNFNLTIKPGEQIGLVGKSGSGKTSLTRLLLRFSDLDSGEILIDGKNITSVTQSDLRSKIAYVPQEPTLFHRTLRENIAYGKKDATEEQIIEAAKKANAMDFVETLQNKFDTVVGERGIKLSGGQRQRVAIARAILKDAPILILDEATSALDSENEKLIQDALWKLMKGRTSIVIAHRLSTIAKLDRIIVMDDGKIVEQGTHNELLESNGMYAKLWQHQSGGFIEE